MNLTPQQQVLKQAAIQAQNSKSLSAVESFLEAANPATILALIDQIETSKAHSIAPMREGGRTLSAEADVFVDLMCAWRFADVGKDSAFAIGELIRHIDSHAAQVAHQAVMLAPSNNLTNEQIESLVVWMGDSADPYFDRIVFARAIIARSRELAVATVPVPQSKLWHGMVPLSVDGDYVLIGGVGAVRLDYLIPPGVL
jgi:hypothetical protein